MELSEITTAPNFIAREFDTTGLTLGQIIMSKQLDIHAQYLEWIARHMIVAHNLSVQNERQIKNDRQQLRDTGGAIVLKALGFVGWIIAIAIALYSALKK